MAMCFVGTGRCVTRVDCQIFVNERVLQVFEGLKVRHFISEGETSTTKG